MRIPLSDHQRWVIYSAQHQTPWAGGAENLVARYRLGQALRLEAWGKANAKKIGDQLSRRPSFTAALDAPALELLIALVSAQGTGIKPDAAPTMAELVIYLQGFVPKKSTPTKAAAKLADVAKKKTHA